MTERIVELDDVHVRFVARGRGLVSKDRVHALTGVDLHVAPGETIGIVGESGCGKSTLARVLVGLQIPTSGTVRLKAQDLSTLAPGIRAKAIGSSIGMVFQDPATALNRRLPVRLILRDPLDVHSKGSRVDRDARVRELMALVGLPDSVADVMPSQLSGGQRQRVAIARALALQPDLIVADEPTSALDVSVRAQILNLFMDLRDRLGLAMVFISHDIQTVRRVADRIVTMYLGRIVEDVPRDSVPDGIRHPYTRALFSATPSLLHPPDPIPLVGSLPSPVHPPNGCPFVTRCWLASSVCAETMPPVENVVGASVQNGVASTPHQFRCYHPLQTGVSTSSMLSANGVTPK